MAGALFALSTVTCDACGVTSGASRPARVPRARIVTTQGAVTELPSGKLAIRDPKVRFVAPGTADAASIVFTYEGPPPELRPLESGAVREQLGLKLRAQDGCNVLYVMWRLRPESAVVVSTKTNPGMTRSEQCGARGYENLRPSRRASPPAVTVGSTHALDAALRRERLTVRIDGAIVWEGDLPPAALASQGPTGVRTDNVMVTLELSAASL